MMLKRCFLLLVCSFFLIASLPAQEAPKEKKVLKNADIVTMIENHFDDETLVKLIEVSDTDFDISADSLLALKNQGASSTVIRAMVQAVQRNKLAGTSSPGASGLAAGNSANAPAPATPGDPSSIMRGMGFNPQQLAGLQAQMAAMGLGGMGGMFSMSSYPPEQMPHVFRMAPAKQEISPSTAQIAQSKFKGGGSSAGGAMLHGLAGETLGFAALAGGPAGMIGMSAFSMASGFMPGMRHGTPSMTYVWGLPGRKSSRELADPTPRFELSYGQIPGVDPDGYEPALVKLFPTKDNYRLVGATRTKMNPKAMMSGMGPESGNWVSEERWPTHLDKEERGFYVLRVDQALEPGEYAVVLRPVKGYKAAPSGFGGAAQVFYSVWDFSVPGATLEEPGKKKKH